MCLCIPRYQLLVRPAVEFFQNHHSSFFASSLFLLLRASGNDLVSLSIAHSSVAAAYFGGFGHDATHFIGALNNDGFLDTFFLEGRFR
jgi:hypothetical protein